MSKIAPTSSFIFPMQDNEADQLSLLFDQILTTLPYYNQNAKSGEIAKYSADQLRAASLANPGSILVAKVRQELVGYCFCREDDATIWLAWFGVHPEYRRSGVGTDLLRAVDQRALDLKAHKIWCDSRTNNEPSKRTLARHGYLQICTLYDHWYRQDFILWEKRVN